MPAAFTTWTVLPHKPIERLAPNLWRVSGKLGTVQRQMVCARMQNGDLVVHNPIALDDAAMTELEAWGTLAQIFVPNGYHRQDARIWKDRYPKAKIVCPTGATKRVAKVVGVDATTERGAISDDTVKLVPFEGLPGESLLQVTNPETGGVSMIFCDAVLNMPKLGFPMNVFLGPTGRISAPRVVRLIALKDKKQFAAQLERLADTPKLERLMFGHGQPITDEPARALRTVVTQLVG